MILMAYLLSRKFQRTESKSRVRDTDNNLDYQFRKTIIIPKTILGLTRPLQGRAGVRFPFSMNSPFARLFLALQERIALQVPDIKHIAQDMGQLSAKSRPPVSWPCVLIDFDNFSFDNLSENVQVAKGAVVLRLGFNPHSGTGKDTPADYREAALAYYDLEWSLHKALQGWSPDGNEYGHLMRTSAATQRRQDGYRIRELIYSISFDDYSTRPGVHFEVAELVVSEQIASQ